MTRTISARRPAEPTAIRGRGGRPRPQRPPAGPEPSRLAEAVARAFLEVEAGRRPLAQLERVLAPALYRRICERLVRTHRRAEPGPAVDAVVAVRTSTPTPEVFDAAIVVRRGGRVGAVVVRLQRYRGAWRVVELACPEERHPAGVTRTVPLRVAARG